MNTYTVYLRKGGYVSVAAWSRTETKREGRIYFHSDEKQKDKSTFFYLRDIAGVHVREEKNSPTIAEVAEYIEALPASLRSRKRKSRSLPVTPRPHLGVSD